MVPRCKVLKPEAATIPPTLFPDWSRTLTSHLGKTGMFGFCNPKPVRLLDLVVPRKARTLALWQNQLGAKGFWVHILLLVLVCITLAKQWLSVLTCRMGTHLILKCGDESSSLQAHPLKWVLFLSQRKPRPREIKTLGLSHSAEKGQAA